ncbi:GNAT family N-acetyltransferase [Pontibacter locisalis]|uniref:GNAT family N-acetyltransferase n=1 Tax=Pontibacter locisalis TaxID=1719035 RepID=A0ABW5IVN2_9BACT
MKYLLKGQETERLKFRLLQQDDFDSWMKLFRAKNVAIFLGLDPTLSEYELCKLWFERGSHRYENDLGGMNVLIEKSTGLVVGQCGLLVQTVEDVERLEVGYSILPEFWGRGFASEGAAKCKNYAFENDLADSLISIIHVDNIVSERVALKNGMALEKKLDSYKGNPVNIFRIDKKNWN